MRISSRGQKVFLQIHLPGNCSQYVMVGPGQQVVRQVHGSKQQVGGIRRHFVTTGPGQKICSNFHSPHCTRTGCSVMTGSYVQYCRTFSHGTSSVRYVVHGTSHECVCVTWRYVHQLTTRLSSTIFG